MGKKGNTWLSVVKRAFRSPSKEDEKKSCRGRDEHQREEDEKKREKRRWIFRKTTVNGAQGQLKNPVSVINDQRHAIAVAVATAAAAEAAVASAQASVEVVRLIRPNFVREQYAAVTIQTAYRGYLARKALRALKGLVRLQALVRGHNVRKQANMTLRCMQALVRVQTRVRDQRLKLVQESISLNNNFWDTPFLQEATEINSISRDGSSITDDWDDRPHTIQEIQAKLQSRKEAALKREKALAYAFSNQIWRSSGNPSKLEEGNEDEKPSWLDRWMATRPLESRSRASTDHRDPIKTVEMDTARPHSYAINEVRQRLNSRSQANNGFYSISSPLHKTHHHSLNQSPSTPTPTKSRPSQIRSASPRCSRVREEERNMTHTPPTGYYYSNGWRQGSLEAVTAVPNYMAATESAKARVRSQSTPKQRPVTPEKERGSSVKKRLYFSVPDSSYVSSMSGYSQSLRSPSFKSVRGCIADVEHYNFSSCTDSFLGETSPSSTGELRRWLR